jgi:dynein heavy chain
MTAFDRDNLQLIFSALVDWWMRKFSYGQNINKLAKGMVGATARAEHCSSIYRTTCL